MRSISLIIHTASFDDFLADQGVASYFTSVLANLERQTFKDFEFVYVDTYYDHNREAFAAAAHGLPFTVKHVPIHPNHRYWFDRGHTYISAAKNTGILHADGELCISCDDAEFFPDDFLETYWKHWKKKHLMLAVHKRLRTIETANGLPRAPISGDIYINDHRYARSLPPRRVSGGLAYAGTSFPLASAIAINGYNERMDACKSLEDSEFGERLGMKGHKFINDCNGFLYIVDHPSYSTQFGELDAVKIAAAGGDGQVTQPKARPAPRKIEGKVYVENYGMILCVRELMEIQANRGRPSPVHMELIRRATLEFQKPPFDPLAPEWAENLEIWMNTPAFDLASERDALRR